MLWGDASNKGDVLMRVYLSAGSRHRSAPPICTCHRAISFASVPALESSSLSDGTLDIKVGDHEKFLEKVIAVKLPIGPDGTHKPFLISHAGGDVDEGPGGLTRYLEDGVRCGRRGRRTVIR